MKNTIAALIVLLALSAAAFAQAPQDPAIEKALLAAPAQARATATVIKWKSDFTYETIKKGTSRLVCYDRPVAPGGQPYSAECTSVANLERVAQSLKTETIANPQERRAAFEAMEKEGKWAKPEFGSIFYNLTGNDAASARTHATICVPGATTKTLGLPETGDQGGAWIMNAGTSAAHIMTPGH
jgi:hypothetical protein